MVRQLTGGILLLSDSWFPEIPMMYYKQIPVMYVICKLKSFLNAVSTEVKLYTYLTG